MTHYQYPQQSWTERAQMGTPVVQSAQPIGFSQPASQPQYGEQLAQQPSFAGPTGEPRTATPSQQGAAQYVSQPTVQAQPVSTTQQQPQQVEPSTQQLTQPVTTPQQQPQQVEPSTQQLTQPVTTPQQQPQQVEPSTQQLTQPIAQPQLQPQQVAVPSEQRLAQPAVSTQQQFPAGPVWAHQPTTQSFQSLPASQSVQSLPAEQAGATQAATGQQAAGGGQAAGQVQPTGGEQAMAAIPESQLEQQAEVTSLAKGMPNVDIYETTDELVMFADVPGVDSEDIDLVGNESSVTLVAKRGEPAVTDGKLIQRECAEELERTIPLPARAEIDDAEASVEDGVVRITLPKSEDVREKRIGIQ